MSNYSFLSKQSQINFLGFVPQKTA